MVAHQADLFEGGGSIPTSPLQFKIVELNPFKASEYNEEWHSVLPKIHPSNIIRNTHYICYGASFENKCYAVAIWSSPVAQNRFKNGKNILELRRMAISQKAPKNTASRMISVMTKMIAIKFPNIERLISYQDTSKHRGTIYSASGWVKANTTKFKSWSITRKRNQDQSIAHKIRWEKHLSKQSTKGA